MAEEPITVSISQESVQSIVRAKIQSELLNALTKDRGGEVLIQKLVAEALAAKVDRNYQKISFLDDLISNVIQAEAKNAFAAWVEANRAKIQAAVQKAIEKDRTLSAKLVTALVNTVQSSYRVGIKIELGKDE